MKTLSRLIWSVILPLACCADELTLGGLFSLTGPGASVGTSSHLGATIAVDVINKTGFLSGHTIRLIVEDNQSKGAVGVSGFRKLVTVDHAPAIVMNLTSVGFAVRDIADQLKIPTFVDSVHSKLTEGHLYVFRNFFSNISSDDAVQKFLTSRGMRRLAVLHAEEELGQEAISDLKKRSSEGAFEIVASESFAKDAVDMKSQLLRIREAKPDLVYVVAYGPAVGVAYNQARSLQINSAMIGSAICGQADVLSSARNALEGTYSSAVEMDRKAPRSKYLQEEYSKRAPGRPIDQNAIASYDNVWVFAEAFKSGARTGEELRNAIVKQKKFQGTTGEIEFNESGDSTRSMVTRMIRNGTCMSAG